MTDRTDDYLDMIAEDQRQEARHNGSMLGDADSGDSAETAPTTWEPVDLAPWLNGAITQPQPTVGIHRSDGLQLLYPGREHAVLGETESGKTWFAIGCVAAELNTGNPVVYCHFEEGDPASTIERLRLLDVDPALMLARLSFYAPSQAPRTEWIAPLVALAPRLVIHDGVNAAMSLLGADVMAVDGAALFRRRLVTPFTHTGAAVLACDHLPLMHTPGRRDAYGSVHKGAGLDGARILLENAAPFGRGMRGRSNVYITKDRPGALRSHGRMADNTPGKTFVGTLVVDDAATQPDFMMRLYAPSNDEHPAATDEAAVLADTVWTVVAAQPDQTVPSLRQLHAHMRLAGHKYTQAKATAAVEDLIAADRLIEVFGKRGAKGYQAITTATEGDPK